MAGAACGDVAVYLRGEDDTTAEALRRTQRGLREYVGGGSSLWLSVRRCGWILRLVMVGVAQPMAQGPGPPQRPQPGGGVGADLGPADSAPTAKVESARAVCVEPHWGHGVLGSVAADMVRTSLSKRWSHLVQWYS